MFSFPTDTKQCTQDSTLVGQACKGFIDVNGVKAPNKLIKCDTGSVTGTGANACQVTNPTDVYPVIFYDQTILPNSPAARAVLYAKEFGIQKFQKRTCNNYRFFFYLILKKFI